MILNCPADWKIVEQKGDGACYVRKRDRLLAIVTSSDQHGDGRTWFHLSVSQTNRPPTYDELKEAKEALLGDRYAVLIFPPAKWHVNIHPHCLHLWATDDDWPIPEFGKYGTL